MITSVVMAAEVVKVKRPVMLTDILDGHAALDISCLDRIYLNGYVPVATSGQVVGFLDHRGFPIPSPTALARNGTAFRQAMVRYAQANGVPWIKFGKDDRKIDVGSSAAGGRHGLIARIPHTNTYQLTPDGQLFAVLYTKVHDRVLYPVMADHHIAAPAEVCRALSTIGRHIASLTAAASIRRAA